MRAMILAAGEGRRLRPLTERVPKALVEIEGVPMLELVLRRLIAAGVDAVAINVCHLADQVAGFLKAKRNFGLRVELSREAELLDTGGGLKKVAVFFEGGGPFFLHNVDVVSDIDLGRMRRFHEESGGLAALAVAARASDRRLLFDSSGTLRGWESASKKETRWAGAPAEPCERLAFNGIHVISPEIFGKLTEVGAFSITRAYLRLADGGEAIRAFRTDEFYCRDIGGPEKLDQVRLDVREGRLRI